MQRYDIYTNDDAWIHHDKDDDGDWVRYEDAAARIASLEAELLQSRDVASDYVILCSKLEAQLATERERNRWVPCTENMPKDYERVQICVKGPDYFRHVSIGWFARRYWHEEKDGIIYNYGQYMLTSTYVTHWRSLPEPPEADHA